MLVHHLLSCAAAASAAPTLAPTVLLHNSTIMLDSCSNQCSNPAVACPADYGCSTCHTNSCDSSGMCTCECECRLVKGSSGSAVTRGEKGDTSEGTDTSSSGCSSEGCWPKMMIIGAQKSGTTSMFDEMHKQGACGSGSSGSIKEGHFFDDDWSRGASHDKYISRYTESKCRGANLFLDATPDYIRHWWAPQRIASFVPSSHMSAIRFLLLLREPASRDLSYYNHMLSKQLLSKHHHRAMSAGLGEKKACSKSYISQAKDPHAAPTYTEHVACEIKIWDQCSGGGVFSSFTAAYSKYSKCQSSKSERTGETGETYLTSGMYSAQLKRWTSYIPRRQIMVVQMEALLDSTESYMEKIYTFLAFPKKAPDSLPNKNEKKYSFTVHKIDCATKSKLKEIFGPWSKHLVQSLSEDRTDGNAPDEEPEFPNWDVEIPCFEGKMSRPRSSGQDDDESEGWEARHAAAATSDGVLKP